MTFSVVILMEKIAAVVKTGSERRANPIDPGERTEESMSGPRPGARGDLLCGALDRGDRQMPTSGVVADSEIERDSGLTSNERLRRGAWGASRPPRAGFEARRPGCRTPMVVDLIGSDGAESRARPVAVVPGEVDGQFLLHGGETVRDQD